MKKVLFAILFLLLTLHSFRFINAENLSATIRIYKTEDPDIISVSGTGFDAQDTVKFELYYNNISYYTFTEQTTTDLDGNFTYLLIIPTEIIGPYNFTASTLNKVAYIEYTFLHGVTPNPRLTATPSNSNIVRVSGVGYEALVNVTLEINSSNGTYRFPDNLNTDADGRFSSIIIIPTRINGMCYLIAQTPGKFAYIEYTVPDLTGATGATGATGPAGEPVNNTLVYIVFTLSILSSVTALYALSKKDRLLGRTVKGQRKKRR